MAETTKIRKDKHIIIFKTDKGAEIGVADFRVSDLAEEETLTRPLWTEEGDTLVDIGGIEGDDVTLNFIKDDSVVDTTTVSRTQLQGLLETK